MDSLTNLAPLWVELNLGSPMDEVLIIFDCLVALRQFAEIEQNNDILEQIDSVESIALAEVCGDYYDAGSDDFYAVMLQIFPDVYRCQA